MLGITIARKYMEELEVGAANKEIIADSIASCAAAEKALLELDASLARLKSLSYRFADPDASIADLAAGLKAREETVHSEDGNSGKA